MWKITRSSALFGGECYLVQTQDTEETVGAFPERADAELFLGALEREHWCQALLSEEGGIRDLSEIRAGDESLHQAAAKLGYPLKRLEAAIEVSALETIYDVCRKIGESVIAGTSSARR